MTFRVNSSGMTQLQNELSAGLEAVGRRVLAEAQARAPVETGAVRDSLHTDNSHSHEWPKPAVFVATASGDGFFVHEGTSDTPAQPFLSQSLDVVRSDIPSIMAKG
jgi:hypothetical protein